MRIRVRDLGKAQSLADLMSAVESHINNNSRFNMTVRFSPKYKESIDLQRIRLKESKVYCGSHPFACDINGGCKSNFLEGADWVEFNDLINDVLDSLHVEANVQSTVCIIRKGMKRRIRYWGRLTNSFINEYTWDLDEHDTYFENYCGMIAPNSEYPEGTPGLYERDERALATRKRVAG